jgi:hypothetical protein
VHCMAFGQGGGSGAGCGEVARGGCLTVCNFSVARATVLTEAETTRPNTTLPLHQLLAPSLPFGKSTGQNL